MPHKLCICQICNCGRHRCPHRSGRKTFEVDDKEPCYATSYGTEYPGETAARRESFKPQNRPFQIPGHPMDKRTTHTDDYIQHPQQLTENFKPNREFIEPVLDMDFGTTYNAVYLGESGQNVKAIRPAQRVIGGGQFRTEITSQDYKAWPISKRNLILPHPAMEHPQAKFNNKSETQTRFIKPDGKAADSAKPPQIALMSADPFRSKTSHQTEYIPKDIPDRLKRDKMVFQPPTVPFAVGSTYLGSYLGSPANRADSFKPANPEYRYGGDSLGGTTHKHDFIPHPLPDYNRHYPKPHEPNDIPMDLNTTTQLEYQGTFGPRALPIKPKSRQANCAPLRTETTHTHDYQPWADARRKLILPGKPYAPPTHAFEGRTEAQSQFQGDHAPAAISAKPPAKIAHTGHFYGKTSYVSDFPIKLTQCAVDTLHDEFDHTHKHEGHHFYQKRRKSSKTAIYGYAKDYAKVGDSQSHEDYAERTVASAVVARPIRIKRRFSDQLIFGQDSPTYSSTNQHAYAGRVLAPRTLPNGADQSVDHVVFGTASPGRMLSTNHADYLNYPANLEKAKRSQVNYLNDSGFVFGMDDASPRFSKQKDVDMKLVADGAAAGVKTERGDLFRSSAGLLLGQSSARYVTQSQADYARKVVQPRDKLLAQLNKEHLQYSNGLIFGEDFSFADRLTTTNDAFGNRVGERAERIKRDLFQPTDGFRLSYGDGEESPRYSAKSRGGKRGERGRMGQEDVDPEWEEYSERDKRQRKRRAKRNSRGARQGSRMSSTAGSSRLVENYTEQSGAAAYTGLTKSQLADEINSISHLTMDSNGLIWFPADNKKSQRKGLPNWAASALNGETTTTNNPDKAEDEAGGGDVEGLKQSRAGVSLTQAGNYAKQDEQVHPGRERKSMPASTTGSDEGLVLDEGSSLAVVDHRQQPADVDVDVVSSFQRQREGNDHEEEGYLPVSRPFSAYSRDSIESARSSAGLDSLDSLERARSATSSVRGATTLFELDDGATRNQHMEELPLEESSILERTRDKMRIPKLIPLRQDRKGLDGTEEVLEERVETVQREQFVPGKISEVEQEQQQENEIVTRATEDSARQVDTNTEQTSEMPATTVTQQNQKLLEDKSEMVTKTANNTAGMESSEPLKRDANLPRNQRSTSITSSQQSQSKTSTGSPANQTTLAMRETITQSSSATNQRKGRRVMSNANSQRNQYPRTTSLGGLMKQGYLEQTTTSQNAYPAVNVNDTTAAAPTPKPRFQKKVPISEDGEYVLTTSRPLQHTPRGVVNTSPKNDALIKSKSNNQGPVEQSPKSTVGKTSDSGRQSLNILSERSQSSPRYRKDSSSHRMPANWSRTLPFRFTDTLRFEGDHERMESRNREDYQGTQLEPRTRSVDPKLAARGNFADLVGSQNSSPRRPRNRSEGPADYSGMFADRRVPFSYADHDIFQGSRERFEGQTENTDSYGQPGRNTKPGLANPKDQLRLFSGRSGTGAGVRSTTHDTFQGSSTFDARPQSLDRKPVRSQVGELLMSQGSVRSAKTLRRNQSEGPADYSGMFADRRVPFTYKDHDIFQGVREKFEGRTENSEAYGKHQAGSRPALANPKDQLRLFSGKSAADVRSVTQDAYRKRTDGRDGRPSPVRPENQLQLFGKDGELIGRTATQDMYQARKGSSGKRPQPFRPENQLELFSKDGKTIGRTATQDMYQDGGSRRSPFRPQALLNIFDGPSKFNQSTFQDAYRQTDAQPRRKPLRPRSALSSSGVFTTTSSTGSSARSRRRVGRDATRPIHTAGIPSRVDVLPPIRGAVLSARSFDETRRPFSATTTNHSDFQNPGYVTRPIMIRQYSSGAMAPDRSARLSETTTSHAAFKRYSQADHTLPILPQENHLFATADPFSSRTTNQEVYRKFEYQAPPKLTRNQSLPSRTMSRSLTMSEADIKPRSRFASRTTNMDTYQDYDKPGGNNGTLVAVAAGLSSTAPVHDNRAVFHDQVPAARAIERATSSDVCPAALIMAGQGRWPFVGEDHGHDYYNLDSAS
ncbi:putative Stabilizer of axonemal microtubules 1 [Hypsibius exemplaris]|uniref:Stabilizer of axonemal microtubules 1 n=1 Tax=Hypsibius exemplaris TaxID=2072580 RepID=A0A1W0X590_HYPEX|nr:putative Stabilizer of axonemal microtubules 1 [Hypsibius exemplaris]